MGERQHHIRGAHLRRAAHRWRPRAAACSAVRRRAGGPARDLNAELNILTAIAREFWLRFKRIEASIAGLDDELAGYLDTILSYLNAASSAAVQASQSAQLSRDWAERPYGDPIPGVPAGRSSLHWSEIAHQWATEAQAWAEGVGALIYDFGLLSEDVSGEEDWGTL